MPLQHVSPLEGTPCEANFFPVLATPGQGKRGQEPELP